MKFIINEYNLFSPKIKNEIDIMCISDIHSDIEKLTEIRKIIKKFQVKILLIPGDLVDAVNDKRNNELLEIIKSISLISSIYIVKGNHDLLSLNKTRKNYSTNSDIYKKLSLIKNVNVLDKDIEYISLNEDINVNSLTLPLKWYTKREKKKYCEDYIRNKKLRDSNKFNILLSHSPRGLINDHLIRQDLDYIKNMDLILCGHMHAGLKPIFLRRKKGHTGLVGPYKVFFPKNAYGLYNNDNSSMIISGGITKLSDSSSGIIRMFNNLFSSEIELIHLKKGKNHNLNLTKRMKVN